ncbi:MAG: hypothetical protein K0R15_2397 [Clostridiales bacterium]|nr:hypothetical protein [Clostridiales bacterium]
MKLNDLQKTVVISLLLFIITQITAFISYKVLGNGWVLVLSGIWMLLTIPIFLLLKRKQTTILYMLINAVMAGVTIAGYYLYENIAIYNITTVSLCYIAILAVNYFAMHCFKFERNVNVIFTIMSILGILVGISNWVYGDLVVGSSIVFASVMLLCLNISFMCYLNKEREYDHWKILKLSTMLQFGSVFFAVITAISEGKMIEFSGDFWPDGKKESVPK